MDQSTANVVVCVIIGSRRDYYNALLADMAMSNQYKLQRVQNCLARVVTGARRRDHIKPVLKELHWLLILEGSASRSRHSSKKLEQATSMLILCRSRRRVQTGKNNFITLLPRHETIFHIGRRQLKKFQLSYCSKPDSFLRQRIACYIWCVLSLIYLPTQDSVF